MKKAERSKPIKWDKLPCGNESPAKVLAGLNGVVGGCFCTMVNIVVVPTTAKRGLKDCYYWVEDKHLQKNRKPRIKAHSLPVLGCWGTMSRCYE